MHQAVGRIFFILGIILVLSACHSTRKVESRGGYLLVKNSIKNKNNYLPVDELEGFIQQSALSGRLAPYFRPGIYFYERSLRGHETKMKLFMRKSFGRKPIIFDSTLSVMTADKLGQYLKNKGFYHARVKTEIKKRRNTVAVTYFIESGPPCIVNLFSYHVPDSNMYRLMMADTANGLLRNGMIYDTYVLDDERERIANIMRNNSYFNFSLSDIYYVADTSGAGLAANVELNVRMTRINIPGTADSTAEIPHPQFYIRNIYMIPDAELTARNLDYDTLVYSYFLNRKDTTARHLHILYDRKLRSRPSFLAANLEFAQGDAYSQLQANRTYKKLISQPIFGAANISMSMQNMAQIRPGEKQWLDCNIKLVRNRLNTFTLGTEGTNSGGRFGIGINTSIQNRNVFRGGEVLSLKLRTTAEIQGSLNNPTLSVEKYLFIFNTLEGGAEVSIDFPRLLIPYRSKFQQSMRQGRTSVTAGAGFEFRTDYKRRISTAAWSYKWNSNDEVRNIFTPLEINYIKIFPSDSFQRYLESLTDPQYKSQYTDHLLTMIRYSIILSNTATTHTRHQYYLRLSAETSGNIPYLFDKASGKTPSGEGYYERLGVRYSEYVRTEFDYRKFWKLSPGNVLAFRFMGGIAMPYGNSESVPFEKSYWLGGANDMRGWRLRSLGPGSFSSTTQSFDKTGDIMLQSTLEYRFPIYSFVLGSLFTDAGNIWLRKESQDFPGGEFRLDRFYKQIALDAGLGLRFDFSFFIFRLDGAIPLYTPGSNPAWVGQSEMMFRNIIWNFGIGYPF
jgi:outer membrane protein assembly factor BamA